MSTAPIVTRFAPSPTGYLHIGGARTALFNGLFARRSGGRFLLRIEDTDRARSTEDAIRAIIDGLDWLDLKADGDILFQFARADRHREVAEAMVARGTAFRCYVTQEELEARRAAAEAARAELAAAKQANAPNAAVQALQARAFVLLKPFRSPYRDGLAAPSPKAPYVVRLRAPDTGEIVNDDLVQGAVSVRADDIDDLVMLRADGTPTYMLAVVVDDHDMGVTHVIRGDDHLTNAARQIPIFTGMGWNAPRYAHIPLIHGPDGAKLSKRHGALGVEAYREMGYLPEGLTAYLLRLGWSPGGDDRVLSKEEAAPLFDLRQVQKGPARLDLEKLAFVNAHFMKALDDDRALSLLQAHMPQAAPEHKEALARAAGMLKSRAKTGVELAQGAHFVLRRRPIALDAALQKLIKPETVAIVQRLTRVLAAEPDWSAMRLAAVLKDFATAEGIGIGQFGPALRALLTGGDPSPDLGQTLAILGRAEALARIGDQVGGNAGPTLA
jgi:glutamyl-tRNA synthetase